MDDKHNCYYCDKKGMCWIFKKMRKILIAKEFKMMKTENRINIYNNIALSCFCFNKLENNI